MINISFFGKILVETHNCVSTRQARTDRFPLKNHTHPTRNHNSQHYLKRPLTQSF